MNKLNMKIPQLVEALDKGTIRPDQLTPRLRKMIVLFFMKEQTTIPGRQVAALIGVTEGQVSRIKHRFLRDYYFELEDDVKKIALGLKWKKDELQRKAMHAADYKLVWDIEMDYIEKMQSLGFVYEAPKKHLVGGIVLDLEKQLKEFVNEFGVPTREGFLSLLRKAAGGDGGPPAADGEPAGIALLCPVGHDREPESEGPED